MDLSLDELEDVLSSTADSFVLALDLPQAKAQARKWKEDALDAIFRAETATDDVARAAARKEVLEFQDAFNLKFATMELRTKAAARQSILDAAKQIIPIVLKSIVGLLV